MNNTIPTISNIPNGIVTPNIIPKFDIDTSDVRDPPLTSTPPESTFMPATVCPETA